MRIEPLEDRSVPAIIFGEDFESTAVGSLPTGWTASNPIGPAPLWSVDTTSAPTPVADDSGKSVWIDDPGEFADKLLTSPAITIPSIGTQLRFRHNYILEETYDGGVLELSINGGPFQDILVAGGSFAEGGYPAGSISPFWGNPIAGRRAWTGSSAGWQTVVVNLPGSTAGEDVRFRWRMGSDEIVSDTGWRVDNVQVGTPDLTLASGDGQNVRIGELFAAPLQVRVVGEFGNPVAGVTVTFSTPSSGPAVTFPDGATAVTDANGYASVAVRANDEPGATTVTAAVPGLGEVTFNLTNNPNPPPENVSAGGPYVVVQGQTMVFTATASDPEGEPLSFTWDINGDGQFGDFLGQRLTLTSLQMNAFGLTTGFSTDNLRVRVSDGRTTVVSEPTSFSMSVFVPPEPPSPVGPPAPSLSNVTQLTAVAAGPGGGPHVQVFNADGSPRFAFFAYSTAFTGGIAVATGDVTGDGVEDVITAAGVGGGPHIKVYDGVTGAELRSFFAYDPMFRNGVSVAAGDVNGDGKADIVTGAMAGGGPHVKVFDGASGAELRSFFAFAPQFTGGVSVAAGDVTGDGRADLVVGAGAGGGPHVKVYDVASMAVVRDFFAFSGGFTGGVNVAAGDFTGDGLADLLVGQASGGSSASLINSGTGANMLSYTLDGATGVRVALSDVTGDRRPDPIVASGQGSGSAVSVLNVDGSVLRAFSPFGGFGGGVFVG